MKFDIVFGLVAAFALAPNAVAWNLPGFGNSQYATPTAQPSSGTEPTGTLPGGQPSFPEPSSPHGSGTIPSGVPGGFPSGFPTGDLQPSGGFGGFGHGGESSFATVPVPAPTPSAGAGWRQEGGEQFERVHARQIRPVHV